MHVKSLAEGGHFAKFAILNVENQMCSFDITSWNA